MLENDYILGLLYGDGHFQIKDRYEWFMFSTTHKELSDKVINYLDENNIKYFNHRRHFPKGHKNENYEILEIIEITDVKFRKFLLSQGFLSDNASERIKWNRDFIRGIIETKGSLFTYQHRNSIAWRISISGNEDDVKYIKYMLETELNVSVGDVFRRRERESEGIISESYRLNIQNRACVREVVNFIKGENISKYLNEMIEKFEKFDAETPYNMKRKVFKHYKFAVGAMARDLGIVIKGKRGGGGKRGFKPVYLWEGDKEIACFSGWGNAYKWICKVYEEELGRIPPEVHLDE
ncbi:hypothetical protein [Bacillus licheniformis]|uniref:hypothetical protein n=1 Tax=Bacillus licheniformis TaxID=1402 RepID=UPI00092703B9|nr:hypothetical protein [Bacillus licheniformis]OJT57358.1 hypothetical protein BFP47_11660 [Bacillus licheniformis]OJT70000.1 hypothetical protein BFP46_05230 [Bacillus licheniformis]